MVPAMRVARASRHKPGLVHPGGRIHVHRIRAEIGEFGPPPPPVPDTQPDGKGAYDLAEDGKPMWLKCVFRLCE